MFKILPQKHQNMDRVLACCLASLFHKHVTKVKVKGHCQCHINWPCLCHISQGKGHVTSFKVIWPWPWYNTHESSDWIQAWMLPKPLAHPPITRSHDQVQGQSNLINIIWLSPRSRSHDQGQGHMTLVLWQSSHFKGLVHKKGQICFSSSPPPPPPPPPPHNIIKVKWSRSRSHNQGQGQVTYFRAK